jgi:UDP-glucose 4-epimerase
MAWRPSWWLYVLKIYWPLNHLVAKSTGIPYLGKVITYLTRPFFNRKSFNISYIPINANIEPASSTVLTSDIIAALIRRSVHRVIIKRCSCRDAKKCTEYPIEDSCMLLGYDTRVISPGIAKHVSVDEALRHMNDKISLGLIPMTGRVRMDDLYYGVPNRGRMLTVCFCCPCCCTVLNSARYFPDEFRGGLVKLKGLTLEVDNEKCRQCGTCIEACFMKAITLEDGKIIHNDAKCIGCGRCTVVCPQKAVRVLLENSNSSVDEIMGRITNIVDITKM